MTCITQVDSTLWALIGRLQGAEIQTPYTPSNKYFQVESVNANAVVIRTGEGGSAVALRREAFQQTLDYLVKHEHVGESNAIKIESNHNGELAGPLCKAARELPNGDLGTVVITYILPILEQCEAVAIGRLSRPTTTWLITQREPLRSSGQ
ncbi:hypothetical protein [Pseudomonas auratipiscis]|uniref:Uncharacterized protein n=1 Tax=Pseudomonas auratipiscis TaxID=3115853 RepID=A0AB35WNU6_9PSED|nr:MULTISPECIES: hypothetical protein [unclassified Pseudomonas]MEE1865801.1 hypothetical protein [Pseudomonas sp. 120P]MEE1957030.1 hypothetical protein [Pseudomonas sp. 119P]